jgi:hypothetical protein
MATVQFGKETSARGEVVRQANRFQDQTMISKGPAPKLVRDGNSDLTNSHNSSEIASARTIDRSSPTTRPKFGDTP